MAQQCVLFQHKDLEYSTHLNYHCDILLELRSLNPPCLYRKQKFDIHNLCVLIVSYDSLQYSNQYNTNYLPVVLESSTIICVRMSITVTMIRKSNWPSFPIFLHPSLPLSFVFGANAPVMKPHTSHSVRGLSSCSLPQGMYQYARSTFSQMPSENKHMNYQAVCHL